MTLQWTGIVLALIALGTIAFGHVAVRKVNYLYGTRPVPYVLLAGLVFLFLSLQMDSDLASAALGILGMTTLWDSFELVRQEERIRRGHAPANPQRPVEPRRQTHLQKKDLDMHSVARNSLRLCSGQAFRNQRRYKYRATKSSRLRQT